MDFSEGSIRRRPQKDGFKLFDDETPLEEDEKKTLFSETNKQGFSFGFFTFRSLLVILIILFVLTVGLYIFYKKSTFLNENKHPEVAESLTQKPATHYEVDLQTIPSQKDQVRPKPQKKKKEDDEEEEEEEEEEYEKEKKPKLQKKKPKLQRKNAKKTKVEKEKTEEEQRNQETKKKEEEQKKKKEEQEKIKQNEEKNKKKDVEKKIKKEEAKPIDKPLTLEQKPDFDHEKFEKEKERLSNPSPNPPEPEKIKEEEKEPILKEIEPKYFRLDTVPEKKNFFRYVIDDYQEGKLPKGLPLIYFSSNHDLNIPYKGHKKYLKFQEDLYKYIENDNYIMPLAYYGYISKIIWVKHSTSHQIPVGTYTVNIGNVEGTEQLAVDRKDILEFFASYSPKLKNPKSVTIQVIELEDWYSKKPNTKSYEDLISIPGEKKLLPPILYANLDFFDFQNPSTSILSELKVSNVDPYIKWKDPTNYCFEKQEDSEKIYKFINALFQAERRYQKIKIYDLAKNIIPLWCKGKEKGEEYFKNLDSLLAKDIRLLTPITRGDLAYHHHTEEEVEGMIKGWLGFLNEIYTLKQLQIESGRPRRPYLSILAVKPYHTKSLLNLIHKLVAQLFDSKMDHEIHDSDELPSSDQPLKKPQSFKKPPPSFKKPPPTFKKPSALKKPTPIGKKQVPKKKYEKVKNVYQPIRQRQRRQRRRRYEDDDDEDEEEDRRKKRNPKVPKIPNDKDRYNTEEMKRRLNHLLKEVNDKPIFEKKGSNKR